MSIDRTITPTSSHFFSAGTVAPAVLISVFVSAVIAAFCL